MLLDFYGPPQTFRMVSYSDVYAGKIDGLKDKIVLVGKVNRQFTNNIDTFFTPFSTDRSGKMAGVEILATQIANLVENRVIISPLPPNLIYLIFSLLISMPACFKIIAKAGLCSLLISLVYLLVSAWLFTKNAYWLPVAVPILVILPLSQLLIQGLMRREIGNANRKLRNTDELTNLSNRRKLIQDLDICINNSEANGSFCALMLIDLDNFKFINEVYGHGAGDALLIQVAHSLFHHLGRHDLLARLGDDEFVVLTTDLQSDADRAKAQCEIVVRKIATCFQKLMLQDGTEFHCTATVGITLFKGHQFSTHEILKYADITLHYAKKKGRNTWQFFDPEMEDTLQKEALLNNYLRQAIERNEFILYYQAQISDNKIVGAEVLIRWLHPTLGMIPPLEFIALAEESGLIIPIGNWVLETACRKLHDWQSQPALAKLILAVNVSVPQFHQPNFVQQVLHICEKTQVNPRRLKLELTESIFVGEFDGIKEKMSEIKSNGISFSLDDFGTGYSALSYLSQLSFEQLKIDQSFVCNLLLDPNNAAITKNIVDLARTLNLHVIAEGVETIEQLHVLAQLGCNSFQGYLFSKPLPIEQFEKYLYSYNECGLNLE
jgi:diguanylate cyclase (GGDEF)-like protein